MANWVLASSERSSTPIRSDQSKSPSSVVKVCVAEKDGSRTDKSGYSADISSTNTTGASSNKSLKSVDGFESTTSWFLENVDSYCEVSAQETAPKSVDLDEPNTPPPPKSDADDVFKSGDSWFRENAEVLCSSVQVPETSSANVELVLRNSEQETDSANIELVVAIPVNSVANSPNVSPENVLVTETCSANAELVFANSLNSLQNSTVESMSIGSLATSAEMVSDGDNVGENPPEVANTSPGQYTPHPRSPPLKTCGITF